MSEKNFYFQPGKALELYQILATKLDSSLIKSTLDQLATIH